MTMRKVSTGQPFRMSAGDFNAFVDAAASHRRRAHDLAGKPAARDTKPGIIAVRNVSGADQPQFSVMALGHAVITPTENEKEFLYRPTINADVAQVEGEGICIIQEPVKAGALGKAMVFGVSPVLVDVVDEEHKYAKALAGEAGYMASASSGIARIIYAEPGTGMGWALVHFPATVNTTIRLGGAPITIADDGDTPTPNEVPMDEALRIIDDGGTFRLALNLASLYVVDPATGFYGPLSSILRAVDGNQLAVRTDAKLSDGTNTAPLKVKHHPDSSTYRADGAFPV